jgi:hypothetical protein
MYPKQHEHPLQEIFDEKGERVSPILPKHVKNFLIDIDGTICEDIPAITIGSITIPFEPHNTRANVPTLLLKCTKYKFFLHEHPFLLCAPRLLSGRTKL